jgi:pectinesterase
MIKNHPFRWLGVSAILLAGGSGLGQTPAPADKTLVVAGDGSGQYRTVQSAVDAIPINGTDPVIVRIKPGTYTERIVVPRGRPHVRFVGEDAAKTILTYELNALSQGSTGRAVGTSGSTSTNVLADDFTAENITFANSTPRDVAQALALSANGDRQVYRRCRFLGWQDTLYANRGRQLFDDCYIEGGVDFIFGAATAVFLNCEIHSKRKGYVTASSTPQDAKYGYVFLNCRLTAAKDLDPSSVYLGRPWRDYSNVLFLNCEMGPHIRPEGWHNWNQPNREKTARFGEFGSTGPGAKPDARVSWSRQLPETEAKAITAKAVLAGRDEWDPSKVLSFGKIP